MPDVPSVPSTPHLISRAQLQEAFRLLAKRLADRGVVGDVYVFGGAAIVLAYNGRAATRDVDAIFEPREIVHEAALDVAEALSLPRWWLNDQTASYLSRLRDSDAATIVDFPNLRVTAISEEHLLAMKALAARRYADMDDIALLATRLGISTPDAIEELCARVYPDEPLTGRAKLVVSDVIARLERERGHGHEGPDLSR